MYPDGASSQLLMTFVGSVRELWISLAQCQNWFKGPDNFKIQTQTDIGLSGFLYICRKALPFDAIIKCPAYPSKGLGFKCLPVTVHGHG